MSSSYTELTLLASGKTPALNGGATTTLDFVWGKSQPFTVLFMEVLVRTAGAQSASKLSLRSYDGSTTEYASVAIGTTVADSLLEARVTDANCQFDAGTKLQILHVTSDATAVYYWKVYGVPSVY